jgi:polyhydroxyalkanoate synthesis repressor PhaR
MPIIKRYPNRKLYDTEAKRYITLDGIAALIREQREITVIDHASGEDLTALTLTQVILEQEKKRRGFLPQTILAGLIQAGGDTMAGVRRTLASSLNLAWHVDQEIERRVQVLMSEGELTSEEGAKLRDLLVEKSLPRQGVGFLDDEGFEAAMARYDIPTRSDLESLNAQLELLAAELDSMRATSPASK